MIATSSGLEQAELSPFDEVSTQLCIEAFQAPGNLYLTEFNGWWAGPVWAIWILGAAFMTVGACPLLWREISADTILAAHTISLLEDRGLFGFHRALHALLGVPCAR